jgi:hypothetical protein
MSVLVSFEGCPNSRRRGRDDAAYRDDKSRCRFFSGRSDIVISIAEHGGF